MPPDDPGVTAATQQTTISWQRNVALAVSLVSLLGIVFAAGASYRQLLDLASQVNEVVARIERIDSVTRSIDIKLAEMRGALGLPTRHAERVP